MRFLFGLIAGALVTLFVAAALDAPADRLVGQLVSASTRIGEVFTEAREASAPEPSPAASLEVPEASLPADTESNLSELPSTPDRGEVVIVEDDIAAVPATDGGMLADEMAGSDSLPPADFIEAAAIETAARRAVAWGPFHSEASASGYARRLSRETGRDFVVEKRAPANYAVVFSYLDADDLAAMQAQIAAVTGIAQP